MKLLTYGDTAENFVNLWSKRFENPAKKAVIFKSFGSMAAFIDSDIEAVKMRVFCDIALCSLVGADRHFRDLL
jgi:hypothetical protein